MATLADDVYLRLESHWIPRHDVNQVILYLLSCTELRYHVLTPEQAALVPYLDGTHTAKELARLTQYLFSVPNERSARAFLGDTVEALNADRIKIALDEKPSHFASGYDPFQFIIPADRFRPTRRLSRPLALLVFFSALCRTSCRYCYADLKNMRRGRMLSIAEWDEILSQARELDIAMIQLSGGDPLGRPDSIDFVVRLVQNDFIFLLSTKCPISAADAHRFGDVGFQQPVRGVQRELQLSVDSPDSATCERLVGRADHFDRALDSARNLMAVGISPIVKAVVTRENADQLITLVERFAALGVCRFRFASYSRSHYRHDDSLHLSATMKQSAADALRKLALSRPEIQFGGDMCGDAKAGPPLTSLERWSRRAGCSAGRTMLGIAPDGRAVLCEQMPMTDSYAVGDALVQPLEDIWQSPKLLETVYPRRDVFVGSLCYDCDSFDDCVHDRGHCFRDAYFAYGTCHTAPPNCPRRNRGGAT